MKTKEVAKTQKKWTVLSEAPKEVFDCLKNYPRAIVQVLWNRGVIPTTNVPILDESTKATNVRIEPESTNIRMETDSGQARMTKEIENFLDPDYESNLHDPFLLKDMDKAVERILKAIQNKEKICVYGDYDVDGITATALLSDLFEKLETDFMTYIPSRHDEGYGLNHDAIDEIAKQGVKLIITVDCGVRSFEEIDYANSLKVNVIVTDHHELQNQKSKTKNQRHRPKIIKLELNIPNAVATINPKRPDCKYPFKDLAGVGVAFKLASAVLTKGQSLSKGWGKWMLDLVALGTVCDVVPLIGENRVLVKYGLKVLAKTKREGLKALIKSAGLKPEGLTSHNLGFHIGPRLNAAGRLEHAKTSLDLLLTNDLQKAETDAFKLSKLNKERQDLTDKILNEAKAVIESEDGNQKIYLLKNKNWPSGVVGIVASKLVDFCGKPVLLMEEGKSESKGSARSIKNFNIIGALSECEEFLVKYGGHKKAAGFTVKNEHFLLLNDKLIEIADEKISEEGLVPEIVIDGEIEIEEIDGNLGDYIKKLEPFGLSNFQPIFILKNANIKNAALVGNEKNHLKLVFEKTGKELSGICFNYGTELGFKNGDKADIIFTITENEWSGRVSLEAKVIDMRVASQTKTIFRS